MSKMKIFAKLLAIAAVLAIGFSACSKTDPDIPSAKPQKIHVSLKANVNDPQTSSSIDYVNGVRTLKISAGDKLYVRAVAKTTWNDDICDFWESTLLCGYLTVEPTTISPSGNSASFTGDLDVYTGDLTYTMDQIWIVDEPEHDEWEIVDVDPDTGEEIWDMIHYDEVGHWENDIMSWDIAYDPGTFSFSTTNPVSECEYADAYFVHAGSEAYFEVSGADLFAYYDYTGLAPDVNTLMTTALSIYGDYNSSSNSFEMHNDGQPILNCTINGLTPGATYEARYYSGSSPDPWLITCYGDVQADASGQVTFACLGYQFSGWYHKLRFENKASSTDVNTVQLGQKTLSAKVYNITATAQ